MTNITPNRKSRNIDSSSLKIGSIVYDNCVTLTIVRCDTCNEKMLISFSKKQKEKYVTTSTFTCRNCKFRILNENKILELRKNRFEILDWKKTPKFLMCLTPCKICKQNVWKRVQKNTLRGNICEKCSQTCVTSKLSIEEITKRLGRYGLKPKTDLLEYKNNNTKITVSCAQNHEFVVTISTLGKVWNCPCFRKNSLGERICREYFEYFTKRPFVRCYPKWLRTTNTRMQLDGYNDELKISFEYNGKQHYEDVNWYGRKLCYVNVANRDELKRKLCEKNNVKLLVIKYDIPLRKIGQMIRNFLINTGYNVTEDVPEIESLNIGNINRNQLTEIETIISEKKGILLTDQYRGFYTPIKIKCSNNHLFESDLPRLRDNSWCIYCAKRKLTDKQEKDIKTLLLQGLNPVEISKIVGISAPTVRRRIYEQNQF